MTKQMLFINYNNYKQLSKEHKIVHIDNDQLKQYMYYFLELRFRSKNISIDIKEKLDKLNDILFEI